MKYINQLNWILVIVAGALVVYTLVNTFWHPDGSVVGSIEIPKAPPVRSQELRVPVQGTPQPNSNSSQSPTLEQPKAPEAQPSAHPPSAGVSSAPAQNPAESGKPNVLTVGAPPRPQGDRAVDPTPRGGETYRPPQAGRPAQPVQGTQRYEVSGPPPTAPGAAKRSAGTDPAAPPIRSSMSNQRPN